jgi:integrase
MTSSLIGVQLGYAVVEGPPKTQRGVRVVDLDRATVEVLRDHAVGQGAQRVLAGDVWKDEGWVFTREDGSPIHPERITRTFTSLSARLGLPPIRLHDLRHGYASHALAAGANMKIIQNQLGHGSHGFTADTYTHVPPHVAAEAAEIIARLLLNADPALAVREQEAPETALGASSDEETPRSCACAARDSNPEPAD